jgi:hypothetical protein
MKIVKRNLNNIQFYRLLVAQVCFCYFLCIKKEVFVEFNSSSTWLLLLEWILSDFYDYSLFILYFLHSTRVNSSITRKMNFYRSFSSLPQSRLQITCTLLLTSVTFRWVVNRSLVSENDNTSNLDFFLRIANNFLSNNSR